MTSSGITLDFSLLRTVLATGADMKNSVAVGRGSKVTMSPHTGDLDTVEGVDRMEQEARVLARRLGRVPEGVAVDLHPDMRSTRMGHRLASEWNCPVTGVQHHHAHAAACLAENGRRGGLALVMDGTGWGGDGTIWGAEVLEVGEGSFRRFASFAPVPLPGGDAAVRRPARQVMGRWLQAGVRWTERGLDALAVSPEEAGVWGRQCERRLNAPLTHAAGRLFDSFSAALGIAPREITYEGQPAIMLETAARSWCGGELPELPFEARESAGLLLIDWAPAFRRLAEVGTTNEDAGGWAMAVHVAVARAAGVMIDFAVSHSPERSIGLSGGVFMNRILNDLMDQRLQDSGLTVLRHRVTPPGDGCIALGQVVVTGMARFEK